jgi:hypothetical protein
MPLFPLLLQILFLALVTSEGPYLVILAERRSPGELGTELDRNLCPVRTAQDSACALSVLKP